MNLALTIDQQQAAAIAGVTDRRIRQLLKEGELPAGERGAIPCGPFGVWLIQRAQRELGVTDDGVVYAFGEQRARQVFHEANLASLKEKQLRGDLVPAGGAILVLQALAGAMKSRLVNLPAVVCQRHPEVSSAVTAEIEDLIREALQQVAVSGLPSEYQTAGADVEAALERIRAERLQKRAEPGDAVG